MDAISFWSPTVTSLNLARSCRERERERERVREIKRERVCVSERERERESERNKEREKKREDYGITLDTHCHLVQLGQILQRDVRVRERETDRECASHSRVRCRCRKVAFARRREHEANHLSVSECSRFSHHHTPQHPATPCNTLQHPPSPFITLYHPATPCNTLQHTHEFVAGTIQQHSQGTASTRRVIREQPFRQIRETLLQNGVVGVGTVRIRQKNFCL